MSPVMLRIAVRACAGCLISAVVGLLVLVDRVQQHPQSSLSPAPQAVEDQPPPVYTVEWSPDGSQLLAVHKVVHSDLGNVVLFDLRSSLFDRWPLAMSKPVRRAVFVRRADSMNRSNAGPSDLVVTGSDDGRVRVIDPESEESEDLPAFTQSQVVTAIVDLPEGELLLGTANELHLFGANQKRRWTLPCVGGVRSVDIAARGKGVVATTYSGVIVVSLQTGKIERRIPQSGACSAAVLADGRRLVTGDRSGTVALWNLHTGALLWERQVTSRSISAVAASALDLAVGDWEGNLFLLDEVGRTLHSIDAHADVVTTVKFSPDVNRLASAGQDGRLLLWDPRTGVKLDALQ